MPAWSNGELYILPDAFKEIKSHINWRVLSARNRYEQGGILIGDVYKEPGTGIVYGLVKSVIPSPRSGDETYIQFTQESWMEMYQALDRKKAANPDGGQMRILGWYHTHPNMRVVMSQVDQNTHRQFFSKYWQFSVIFNPQRGIWSVFNGADCRNCRGELFCPQEDYEAEPYIAGSPAVSQADASWYHFPSGGAGNGAPAMSRHANGEQSKPLFKVIRPSTPVSSDRQSDAASGQRPNAAPGQHPNAAHGQQLPAAHGQQLPAAFGQHPNAASGQQSDAASGQRPDAASGQRPNAASGQRPNAAFGQRSNAAHGQQLPAAHGQQLPAAHGQQLPAASGQQSNAASGERKPPIQPVKVIQNIAQTAVNAMAPPDRFIYSERLYNRSTECPMVIPRELVEQFLYKVDLPNYITERNELILLYPLKSPYTLTYNFNGEVYHTFENPVGNALKATGFWYITDSGQYVEYLEREQSNDRVKLAVVYSNRPVDENKLRDWHEVTNLCDCVLWLNLRNTNQPRFYALPKRSGTYPFSPRFPHQPGCGVLRESAGLIWESKFSERAQNDWLYFQDSTGRETGDFKISPKFIRRLFEQLQRLQMRSDCCVAVTYKAGFDLMDKNAMNVKNEPFLTLRVLSPRNNSVDVDANFYNTPYPDNERDGIPKFVFLFSGGEIDVEQMKTRLSGRHSALVLNVEDAENFRICRLFPNA